MSTAGPREDALARVVVVGCSCSGKSTLARQLADALAAPYVELDALRWDAGWQPRPADEFLRLADAATAGPRWIVDGNYGRVRPIVWPRATAVVWLNLGFVTVLARALTRTLRRAWSRERLFSGNYETFGRSFLSRDSILWWVATSYRPRTREFAALMRGRDHRHLAWHELRSSRAARSFVRAVRAGEARAPGQEPA